MKLAARNLVALHRVVFRVIGVQVRNELASDSRRDFQWCTLDHQSRVALANLLASFEASAPPACSGLGAAWPSSHLTGARGLWKCARTHAPSWKTSSYGPQRDYRAIHAALFDEISLNGCAPILGGRSANAATRVCWKLEGLRKRKFARWFAETPCVKSRVADLSTFIQVANEKLKMKLVGGTR